MHLVSCRHSISGLTALRNLATRSMRSRTELMFQVVTEKRISGLITGIARSASDEAIHVNIILWIASRSLSSGAHSRDPVAVCPAWALTWRWKSSRELVTASEANRRASDREAGVKEAGSETAGRRTGTG